MSDNAVTLKERLLHWQDVLHDNAERCEDISQDADELARGLSDDHPTKPMILGFQAVADQASHSLYALMNEIGTAIDEVTR